MTNDLPEYHHANFAAVCLLRSGVVYSDEAPAWDLTLSHQTRLEDLFATFGLRLVIAEDDGYAYVRQLAEEEEEEGYENLPRLMRTVRMTYEQTLLCLLLRAEICRFEDEELHSTKCVVSEENLFAAYLGFFGTVHDEKRLKAKFAPALKRITEFGFAKKLNQEPPAYLVRPILKARFSLEQMEQMKAKLLAHQQKKAPGETPED
tara:strand:+ start:2450 stop:3064 length:615 start_codon:yes stop_codon:yes gene_type:complete